MTSCIKCGAPIADGELFCPKCALNLAEEAADTPRTVHMPAVGKMQAPVKKKPVAAKPAAPAAVSAPAVKPRKHTGLIITMCIITVLSLVFAIWQFSTMASNRVALRVRESEIEQREEEFASMQQQLQDLQTQLLTADETIDSQQSQIDALQQNITEVESTKNQTQYDYTTQKTALEQLQAENEALQQTIADLESQNEDLQTAIETMTEEFEELTEQSNRHAAKSQFMDSYVVFVENNGTSFYHKYDCEDFSGKSFWAYSRKLAESNGYESCSKCFN